MSYRPPKAHRGFTLIELSIVLVIIGLVVAGIVVGKSMRRSAAIQALITDEAHYVEAARQFKEKYGFPPGDFPNATTYWGTDTMCPNNTSAKPGTATCNGNGDNMIQGAGVGASNAASYEAYRAWQQLADAGLTEGTFTGSAGPGSSNSCEVSSPGVNVPATRLENGGMEWMSFSPSGTLAAQFLNAANYQQYILIGGNFGGCNLMVPILSPSEAYSLDLKVDDGMPGMGNVTSLTSGTLNPYCTTNAVPATSMYISTTASATPQCVLLFQVNF